MSPERGQGLNQQPRYMPLSQNQTSYRLMLLPLRKTARGGNHFEKAHAMFYLCIVIYLCIVNLAAEE